MKPNYSGPYIYTGNVDIQLWSTLSKLTKEEALSKEWYVYFSFRNPQTGKLVRQTNIKTGVNSLKTKKERYAKLETIKDNLLFLLKKGFNPYVDNSILEEKTLQKLDTEINGTTANPVITAEKKPEKIPVAKVPKIKVVIDNEKSIKEAFQFGLKIKQNVLGATSYSGFQGRINRFLTWLDENGSSSDKISTLEKKTFITYLNSVLENTSASNRNNTRTDLSALVQTIVDNELMHDNYVKSINVLKSAPERNKTYSVTQEKDILEYIEQNDAILLLYIQFITYNFLRPVEVNRLKIGDLDLEGKKLFVRAKNKAVKVKIIPQKIIDLLPDLSSMDPNHYLFTPTAIGAEWEAEENNRRDNFSKKFKLVKDHFKLNKDYGLYSFRHTAITNLYREIRKIKTPHEAKSILMGITGHQTIEALEKYLRYIDAELPDDYSHLLK
ncbi:tyrosine-type recombinase/integrase [Flavobacterium sp. WC2409]|uniref:Tyrosine-type recombinase/integrase n=1 Tax=Flavobacterium sp. WC2409 TaxID=3234139 RepID=A0AB39W3G7_9FLAO